VGGEVAPENPNSLALPLHHLRKRAGGRKKKRARKGGEASGGRGIMAVAVKLITAMRILIGYR
jgi:hypothetical protein